MKFVLTILLAITLPFMAAAQSQDITLSLHNAPLSKALQLIEQQSGYSFVYSDEAMALATPVTVRIQHESLDAVLQLCFANQQLGYTVDGKMVIVKVAARKQDAVLTQLKGQVTGADGKGLPGATVVLKRSGVGTAADENGYFMLTKISGDDVLVVTSLGYLKKEVPVKSQQYIVVKLTASSGVLQETMVIGYGLSTRMYNVGSVTKVYGEDISKQPVGNVLAALEGKSPGLLVNQSTGIPGSSVKIQIRGQNSLKTNPNTGSFMATYDYPLFIIDGVPFAPQNSNINQFSSIGATGSLNPVNQGEGMSPFNSLNTADIESIEILRDADATAIYGSRGANGVIIITTKKGKPDKTSFSLDGYTGVSTITRTMDLLNTQQYLAMRSEGFYNDSVDNPNAGIHPDIYNAPDLLAFDKVKYTDWKKYFIGGSANTVSVNGNVSGGNEHTQFFLGTGYRRESYIFPGDFSDQKMSFNTSVNNVSADHKLSIDFSANYSYDKNLSCSNTELLKAVFLPPNYPDLVTKDGAINWNYNGVNLYNNPIGALRQKYLLQSYNLISHLQIGYKILPALTIRSSFGFNKFDVSENAQAPASTQNPIYNPTGSSYFGTNNFESWIIEPQLEYRRTLLGGKFDLLIGGTYQQSSNSQTNINGYGYTNDALLGSVESAAAYTIYANQSLYKYVAIFGRLNYVLDDKYILNITGRRDGSSRFGPGRQFGNFASVGGGWIFSEEKFFKRYKNWISYGKIKGSFGTTGNDNIGDYQYLSTWSLSYNSYQGNRGYIPQNLYNPNFEWAVNRKLQTGIELGFFSNKVVADVVWFRNRCGNQLVSYLMPSQTGFSSVIQNFNAVVQNDGIEIEINSPVFQNKNFTWNAAFNLSFPKNKLISFPDLENSPYKGYYKIGSSLNVLQKFNYIGVNDTTGLYQFTTLKGEPTYTPDNPNDFAAVGNLDPKYYGGLKNSISFKGFELDIYIEFKKQLGLNYLGQILNGTPPGILNALYGNQPAEVLNRWQEEGDRNPIGKFTANYGTAAATTSNSFFFSSGSYNDASYLRIKTISLTYSFPKKRLSKLGMRDCRIYVSGQNLMTITHYKGSDPETQSFYGIPPMKTVSIGLQFKF